jgi:hypothetical protein
VSAGPIAVVLLVAVALSGCGEDALDEVERLRDQGGPPLYWAGDSFAELPLTHVESGAPGHVLVVYGDCEPSSDSGCAPPIEIQQVPIEGASPPIGPGSVCRRVASVRGVPAVRVDGLVILTSDGSIRSTPGRLRRSAPSQAPCDDSTR